MKMTKLEKFVWDNPHASFVELAGQTNRTVSSIERAYDRARKKAHAYKPTPASVPQNPKESEPASERECSQAFRVVLHKSNTGRDWVTHLENLNADFTPKACRDFYWGHYFANDYAAALADYFKRCEQYQLDPHNL